MNSLQREGRALIESARFGGTADISSAYHHIPMHPDSTCYLGFEWEGQFYQILVLPFGLSTAPLVFSTVMDSWPTRSVSSNSSEYGSFRT